jgi:hypothetical protein
MTTTEHRSADVVEREASRGAINNAARSTAKRALRAVGVATASRRPLPNFLVVGAKRGGTTSFLDWLREHPGVLGLFPRAEQQKGLYFFDERYGLGEDWYRSHFPTDAARLRAARRLGYPPVVGEASPYYLFHPLAAERAHALVPDALVLALLRDPVERAYSHWKERRRNGTEPLDFADALEAEAGRLAGEEDRLVSDPTARSFAHRHASYVAQGEYAPMLRRWFAAYGRDRVWVAASEDVFAAPQAALDDVHARLGLPEHRLDAPRALNAEPSPELDPGVRRELRTRLTPSIRATEALLGRTLPWERD